jgi:hypothetical protein
MLASLAPSLSAALRGRLELVRQIVPSVSAAPPEPAATTGDQAARIGPGMGCKKKCHSGPNRDPDGDSRGEYRW